MPNKYTYNNSILILIQLSDAWNWAGCHWGLLAHLPLSTTGHINTSHFGCCVASKRQGFKFVTLCGSCISWALLGSVVKSCALCFYLAHLGMDKNASKECTYLRLSLMLYNTASLILPSLCNVGPCLCICVESSSVSQQLSTMLVIFLIWKLYSLLSRADAW